MPRPEVFEINDFGNPLLDNNGLSDFGITPIDNTVLTQDGVGGGGGTSATTISNIFVLNIASNEGGFVTFINDEQVANSRVVRISRESLLTESKKIEIKKEGFSTNEYYIIEMLNDASPVIINPKFEQPLGITTKDITLTKYVDDVIVSGPTSIKNSVSSELIFKLNKNVTKVDEVQQLYKVTFKISGNGLPVSILKNGNKTAEFFPATGVTNYEDVSGTKYNIRSSDLSLYRISSINFFGLNAPKNLKANAGESLEVSLTLNSDYNISIITEEVKQTTPALNPQIQLIKTGARTYNINSKVGLPIMFKKNSDVKTITIIVGDDVLEFTDLDSGDLCGVTIPPNVFKNIGKYNVKIFPFSLDEYENEVRPQITADTIQPKQVEVKYDITEITEPIIPTIDDVYNPYSPAISSGGGSGMGTAETTEKFNTLGDENLGGTSDGINDPRGGTVGGGVGGSFVNRRVDNRNIR